MAIMSAKRVRHLPVINDGELLGIVSIGISSRASSATGSS
jgi:CBS domain-containing protein